MENREARREYFVTLLIFPVAIVRSYYRLRLFSQLVITTECKIIIKIADSSLFFYHIKAHTCNSCTFIRERIQITIEIISFPCKKFRVFARCHLQPDSRLPDTNLLFNWSIFSFNASNSGMCAWCRRNRANPQVDRRAMRIITQPWQTQWAAVCGILHGCKHRYDFKQMLFSGSRPAGRPADRWFRVTLRHVRDRIILRAGETRTPV